MPRSGSTLLQNILSQNPNIVASPTSVLGELIESVKTSIKHSPTVKAEGYNTVLPKFKSSIYSMIEGWHKEALFNTNKNVYIDKSRSWLFNKELLEDIYGDNFKIICMVRDLKDVVSSMEKNHRKNIYRSDHIYDSGAINLTQRINKYLSSVPIMPFVTKLEDIIQCNNYSNIIFIKYEKLLENPQEVIKSLYKALGMKPFDHDFNNIEQSTHEDDEFHGIYGQHKIKSKLENPNNGSYFNENISKLINSYNPIYQNFFGYV